MENCNCCITYNAPDLMDGGVTAARIEEEATDPTPLQERIERILAEHPIQPPTYAGDDPIAVKRKRTAARVVKEVHAEISKAQAEAWTDCVSEASALGWLHATAALDMLYRNPHEKED